MQFLKQQLNRISLCNTDKKKSYPSSILDHFQTQLVGGEYEYLQWHVCQTLIYDGDRSFLLLFTLVYSFCKISMGSTLSSYISFSQIYWSSFSHHFFLCAFILYVNGGTYMTDFFSYWVEVAEKILFVFCFDVWHVTRTLTLRLINQHVGNMLTTATSSFDVNSLPRR